MVFLKSRDLRQVKTRKLVSASLHNCAVSSDNRINAVLHTGSCNRTT